MLPCPELAAGMKGPGDMAADEGGCGVGEDDGGSGEPTNRDLSGSGNDEHPEVPRGPDSKSSPSPSVCEARSSSAAAIVSSIIDALVDQAVTTSTSAELVAPVDKADLEDTVPLAALRRKLESAKKDHHHSLKDIRKAEPCPSSSSFPEPPSADVAPEEASLSPGTGRGVQEQQQLSTKVRRPPFQVMSPPNSDWSPARNGLRRQDRRSKSSALLAMSASAFVANKDSSLPHIASDEGRYRNKDGAKIIDAVGTPLDEASASEAGGNRADLPADASKLPEPAGTKTERAKRGPKGQRGQRKGPLKGRGGAGPKRVSETGLRRPRKQRASPPAAPAVATPNVRPPTATTFVSPSSSYPSPRLPSRSPRFSRDGGRGKKDNGTGFKALASKVFELVAKQDETFACLGCLERFPDFNELSEHKPGCRVAVEVRAGGDGEGLQRDYDAGVGAKRRKLGPHPENWQQEGPEWPGEPASSVDRVSSRTDHTNLGNESQGIVGRAHPQRHRGLLLDQPSGTAASDHEAVTASKYRSRDGCVVRRKRRFLQVSAACGTNLSDYLSSAASTVPETSYNCLHGTLEHIFSADGLTWRGNPSMGAVERVKLNVSGRWKVQDVWELTSGSAAGDRMTRKQEASVKAEPNLLSWKDFDSCVSSSPPLLLLLLHMSTIPWPEQQRFRRVLETLRGGDDTMQAAASQMLPELGRDPSRGRAGGALKRSSGRRLNSSEKSTSTLAEFADSLSLKEVGPGSRRRLPATAEAPSGRFESGLNGEWESDHLFRCCACGALFDELREVMHHKWEAHPYCLVTHITLRSDLRLPPPAADLMHPQMGRQLRLGRGSPLLQFNAKDAAPSGGSGGGIRRRQKRVAKPAADEEILERPGGESAAGSEEPPKKPFECTRCSIRNPSGGLQDGPEGTAASHGPFDSKEEFYAHILVCGGDQEWEGKRDGKKKRSKLKRLNSAGSATTTSTATTTPKDRELALKRKLERMERFQRPPQRASKGARKTRLQVSMEKEERRRKWREVAMARRKRGAVKKSGQEAKKGARTGRNGATSCPEQACQRSEELENPKRSSASTIKVGGTTPVARRKPGGRKAAVVASAGNGEPRPDHKEEAADGEGGAAARPGAHFPQSSRRATVVFARKGDAQGGGPENPEDVSAEKIPASFPSDNIRTKVEDHHHVEEPESEVGEDDNAPVKLGEEGTVVDVAGGEEDLLVADASSDRIHQVVSCMLSRVQEAAKILDKAEAMNLCLESPQKNCHGPLKRRRASVSSIPISSVKSALLRVRKKRFSSVDVQPDDQGVGQDAASQEAIEPDRVNEEGRPLQKSITSCPTITSSTAATASAEATVFKVITKTTKISAAGKKSAVPHRMKKISKGRPPNEADGQAGEGFRSVEKPDDNMAPMSRGPLDDEAQQPEKMDEVVALRNSPRSKLSKTSRRSRGSPSNANQAGIPSDTLPSSPSSSDGQRIDSSRHVENGDQSGATASDGCEDLSDVVNPLINVAGKNAPLNANLPEKISPDGFTTNGAERVVLPNACNGTTGDHGEGRPTFVASSKGSRRPQRRGRKFQTGSDERFPPEEFDEEEPLKMVKMRRSASAVNQDNRSIKQQTCKMNGPALLASSLSGSSDQTSRWALSPSSPFSDVGVVRGSPGANPPACQQETIRQREDIKGDEDRRFKEPFYPSLNAMNPLETDIGWQRDEMAVSAAIVGQKNGLLSRKSLKKQLAKDSPSASRALFGTKLPKNRRTLSSSSLSPPINGLDSEFKEPCKLPKPEGISKSTLQRGRGPQSKRSVASSQGSPVRSVNDHTMVETLAEWDSVGSDQKNHPVGAGLSRLHLNGESNEGSGEPSLNPDRSVEVSRTKPRRSQIKPMKRTKTKPRKARIKPAEKTKARKGQIVNRLGSSSQGRNSRSTAPQNPSSATETERAAGLGLSEDEFLVPISSKTTLPGRDQEGGESVEEGQLRAENVPDRRGSPEDAYQADLDADVESASSSPPANHRAIYQAPKKVHQGPRSKSERKSKLPKLKHVDDEDNHGRIMATPRSANPFIDNSPEDSAEATNLSEDDTAGVQQPDQTVAEAIASKTPLKVGRVRSPASRNPFLDTESPEDGGGAAEPGSRISKEDASAKQRSAFRALFAQPSAFGCPAIETGSIVPKDPEKGPAGTVGASTKCQETFSADETTAGREAEVGPYSGGPSALADSKGRPCSLLMSNVLGRLGEAPSGSGSRIQSRSDSSESCSLSERSSSSVRSSVDDYVLVSTTVKEDDDDDDGGDDASGAIGGRQGPKAAAVAAASKASNHEKPTLKMKLMKNKLLQKKLLEAAAVAGLGEVLSPERGEAAEHLARANSLGFHSVDSLDLVSERRTPKRKASLNAAAFISLNSCGSKASSCSSPPSSPQSTSTIATGNAAANRRLNAVEQTQPQHSKGRGQQHPGGPGPNLAEEQMNGTRGDSPEPWDASEELPGQPKRPKVDHDEQASLMQRRASKDNQARSKKRRRKRAHLKLGSGQPKKGRNGTVRRNPCVMVAVTSGGGGGGTNNNPFVDSREGSEERQLCGDPVDKTTDVVNKDGSVVGAAAAKESVFEAAANGDHEGSADGTAETGGTSVARQHRRSRMAVPDSLNLDAMFKIQGIHTSFPIEVKVCAIERIQQGSSRVQVARDLHCPVSTVASWWQRKGNIIKKLKLKRSQASSNYAESSRSPPSRSSPNGSSSSGPTCASIPEVIPSETPESMSLRRLPEASAGPSDAAAAASGDPAKGDDGLEADPCRVAGVGQGHYLDRVGAVSSSTRVREISRNRGNTDFGPDLQGGEGGAACLEEAPPGGHSPDRKKNKILLHCFKTFAARPAQQMALVSSSPSAATLTSSLNHQGHFG